VPADADHVEKTTRVIAGGGPAGIMLGLLLARGGVDVTVMEKHADFLRDFRRRKGADVSAAVQL
jgi:2-polyprenyl-6-methoxyphenol hydroxylase-like FAD-dependent oxidoreductase